MLTEQIPVRKLTLDGYRKTAIPLLKSGIKKMLAAKIKSRWLEIIGYRSWNMVKKL